jgi:hypothetical protein
VGSERYQLWQWHSRRNPIAVYRGQVFLGEYEGRAKLLRAWLCIARNRLARYREASDGE